MNKVLLVAYHFPPQAGSSGLLRTLKLCRYLPEFGWQPTVLTVHPRAYERLDQSQLGEIAPDVRVLRAFALDARRQLSFRARYLNWTALPDRWVSWFLGGVPAGWNAIRKDDIEVIWTTFPIATAVLIGWMLHRLTRKPWVVDFRDSMTEDEYPRDPRTRKLYRWIERQAVRRAARLVFTAHSTMRMYLQRYPGLSPEKCLVISNGYDEADFQALLPAAVNSRASRGPIRLVHMGILYPEERDPLPFFRSLAQLKREDRINASSLRIELRASGYDDLYAPLIEQMGIKDLVHLLPALPYRQALSDAAAADALLLFQAANCDHQIPAKAYEYLRLGRPILALTSATGDTAELLNAAGGATIVNLADAEEIYHALPDFLAKLSQGALRGADLRTVQRYSRREQTGEMARTLSSVCS